jgi:hypothetical protein
LLLALSQKKKLVPITWILQPLWKSFLFKLLSTNLDSALRFDFFPRLVPNTNTDVLKCIFTKIQM